MRRLNQSAIASALTLVIPGVLATLDADGFPYLTPLWFLHEPGVGVVMTSGVDRLHVKNLRRDPRASFIIEHEGVADMDGRPNVQVKSRGVCSLDEDHARWTRRITKRFAGSDALAELRAAAPMVAIVFEPDGWVGVVDGPRSEGRWWVDALAT